MVAKKKDLIDRFSAIIGDDKSDEAISFLEDLSDSVNDDLQSSYDQLKADYDKLDGVWRDRYISRFKNIGEEKDVADTIEVKQPENETDVVDAGEEDRVEFEDIVI